MSHHSNSSISKPSVRKLDSYLSNVTPVRVAPGTNIVRSTVDPKQVFSNGATTLRFYPSTTSTIQSASVRVVDPYVHSVQPGAQNASLPKLEPILDELCMTLIPSVGTFNVGTYVEGVYGDRDSELDALRVTGLGAFTFNYLDYSEMSTVSLTSLKIGECCVELGDYQTLAESISENVSSYGSVYHNAAYFELNGVTGHGDNASFRPLMELGISASVTTVGSAGYGTWTNSGEPTDYATYVLPLLECIQFQSAVVMDPISCRSDMRYEVCRGTIWPGCCAFVKRSESLTDDPEPIQPCDLPEGAIDWTNPLLPVVQFDFEIPCHWELVEVVTWVNTTGGPAITFAPCTVITEGVTVNVTVNAVVPTDPLPGFSFDAFVADFNNGNISFAFPSGPDGGYELAPPGVYPTYLANGTDRRYDVPGYELCLPRGTSSCANFTIRALMEVPYGMLYPTGTIFSQIDSLDATANLFSFDRTVFDHGYILDGDSFFDSIVTPNHKIRVRADSEVQVPSSVPDTASWEHPFCFASANFSNGATLRSWLKFRESTILDTPVLVAPHSKLEEGTILPAGTSTMEGQRFTSDLTFNAGTQIDSDTCIDCVFELDAITPQNPIAAGSTIRAFPRHEEHSRSESDRKHSESKEHHHSHSEHDRSRNQTVIPAQTVITSGNRLPGDVKVNVTDKVTLEEGMTLCKGYCFGPGFVLTGAHGFGAGFVFHEGSTLSADVSLPAGTELCVGSRFSFPLPVPEGVVFCAGHKLPEGTLIANGTKIPHIGAKVNEDLVSNVDVVPYLVTTTTYGGKYYIAYPAGTVFTRGVLLPSGTVMTNQALMSESVDVTGPVNAKSVTLDSNVYSSGWVTSNSQTLLIDQADYSLYPCSHHNSQQIASVGYDFVSGVPTNINIYMLTDLVFPYTVLLPFSDSPEIFCGILFAQPYVLLHELCLKEEYRVCRENSVFYPASCGIPFNFVLNTEFIIPSTTTITHKIRLPSGCNCDLYYDILAAPGSSIKYPPTQKKIEHELVVGYGGLLISNATGGSRSYIILPHGQLLFSSYDDGEQEDGLLLKTPIPLKCDWKIAVAITSAPAFAVAGMFIREDGTLPGSVTYEAGCKVPTGLSLSNKATLACDYCVEADNCDGYLIASGAYFPDNTKLETGTVFVNGAELLNFEYGPVRFAFDMQMSLDIGTKINHPLSYHYFSGMTILSVMPNFHSRVEELETLISLLEQKLSASDRSH